MEKFLKEIESFEIRPKNKILQGQSGRYKGLKVGDSMDFHEHRVYSPQDDIRKIDWKAYMRTNDLYIKQFNEERQAHIKVILDNSTSMNYGNPTKLHIGRILSLGIGFLTIKQMDLFSLISINSEAEVVEDKIMTQESFQSLMKKIWTLEAKGMTDYKSLLDIDKFHGGITFFITDCFGDKLFQFLNGISVKNEEIILVHILSQEEINPKVFGALKLIDMETREARKTYIDGKLLRLYEKKIRSFIEEVESQCTARGIKYVLGSTDLSPVNILAKALGGSR